MDQRQKNVSYLVLSVLFTVVVFFWHYHMQWIYDNIYLLSKSTVQILYNIVLSFTLIFYNAVLVQSITYNLEINLEKRNVPEEQIFIAGTVWRYGLGFITLIVILSLFIKNWSVLVTSIGIIGAGIAVALQHMIMNLMGWMIIMFNRPFRIGDRIEIEGMRGDVFDISMMFTKLRRLTQDDQPTGTELLIPNEQILTKPLINLTFPTRFVWDSVTVSVTYESDIALAKKIANRIMEKNLKKELEVIRRISAHKRKYTKEANFTDPRIMLNLGASSIDMNLRYLVIVQHKNMKRTQILNDMILAFEKTDKVNFAYPHMHMVYDNTSMPWMAELRKQIEQQNKKQ